MIIRPGDSAAVPRDFVKVVVDVERGILAAGCELHSDCADELVGSGSSWKNLWGANVYPDERKIDFVSLINIRPAEGNRSMEIQIPEVRVAVEKVINGIIFS